MASPYQVPAQRMSAGSPYCSDPTCPYCEELREAEERLRLCSSSEEDQPPKKPVQGER